MPALGTRGSESSNRCIRLSHVASHIAALAVVCRTIGLLQSPSRSVLALSSARTARVGSAPRRGTAKHHLQRSAGPRRARRRLPRVRLAAAAGAVAEKYPAHARHPELFDPKRVDEWVLPEMREALRGWQEGGDPMLIDVEALPGIRLDAPGVISFSFLERSFCDRLLDEVRHYTEESSFPQMAPNSMNRYGVILNEIGMRPAFSALLQRYLRGIGARLFGDPSMRARTLEGVPLGNEDWGGSSLSDHHTFVVRYQPDRDRGLDMHVDQCDITFNVGLCGWDKFFGGDLVFCGMYGDPRYRQEHHTYVHEAGRCVVHAGKRRHAVSEVVEGERASLVIWTESLLWRGTAEYKRKVGDFAEGRRALPLDDAPPDRVCLSLTHDQDYLQWMR